MKLSRQLIVWTLQAHGLNDAAAQAERELPAELDSQRDAGLVSRFGVNPADLGKISRRELPRPNTHRGTWPVPGGRLRRTRP